jgi:hypothetical protein
MLRRTPNQTFGAVIALSMGLLALPADAQVVDFGKYPDWKVSGRGLRYRA